MTEFSHQQAAASAIRLRGSTKIPGPWWLSRFFHTHRFLTAQDQLLEQSYSAYGNVFSLRLYGRDTIVLVGPEANQWVLTDREEIFSSQRGWQPQRALFSNSLLLQDFAEHKDFRKILQGGFKAENLRRYERANRQILEPITAQLGWGEQPKACYYQDAKIIAMAMALSMFFDIEPGDLQELKKLCDDFATLLSASCAAQKRLLPLSHFRAGVNARERVMQYLKMLLKQSTAPMALMLKDAIADQQLKFSLTDALDQLLLLLLGAHNNAATLFAATMWSLANDEGWQHRMRLLIDNRANAKAADSTINDELEWTLKEVLRLYPPITNIPRYATTDSVFAGYRIRQGKQLILSPWLTHRSTQYWRDPQRFDPLRFSPARAEDKQHRFVWLPFGGGAHKCIGVNVAINQAMVFSKFLLGNFYLTRQQNSSFDLNLMPTLEPKSRFTLALTKC